jgi:DNA invertase Pin-like site-specific DNA recombinase
MNNTAQQTRRPVCYAYCRASTPRQASAGTSLEGQQQALRRYCDHRPAAALKLITEAFRKGGKR